MRKVFAVLTVFAVVAATSAIALARGAPPDNQPIAVERAIVGYDVVQNLSESKTLTPSVTTERRRQSTTVAEQFGLAPQPRPVPLK